MGLWNPLSAAGTAARYYGNAVKSVSNTLPVLGGGLDYLAGGSAARVLGQERGLSEATGYGLTNNFADPSNVSSASNKPAGNITSSKDQQQTPGTTYGSNGGGGSTYDPTSVIEAQDIITQAQGLLSRLPGQRDIFNSNLTSTFGNYRNQLQNDFGRNQEQYNTSRLQTTQDNEQAKAQIDNKVRQRANALQRLLGAAGAGDSQAAMELAPYAAARTGTQLRNQVNQTYGRNISGLDNSWGEYNTDYTNSLNSLADQEKQKRNEFETSILQQQLGAMDNLRKGQSSLAYAQNGDVASAKALREQALPAMFQILQQIDQLGRQQITPTVQDASYVAPDVAQYTTENAQPVGGVDQSVQGDVNPYYQWLLKKGQEDNQFFGY